MDEHRFSPCLLTSHIHTHHLMSTQRENPLHGSWATSPVFQQLLCVPLAFTKDLPYDRMEETPCVSKGSCWEAVWCFFSFWFEIEILVHFSFSKIKLWVFEGVHSKYRQFPWLGEYRMRVLLPTHDASVRKTLKLLASITPCRVQNSLSCSNFSSRKRIL